MLTLIEALIPPQGGPPPHLHRNEDEAFYLLEGELEVLDHDRTFVAQPLSFIFIPHGTVHGFKNISDKLSKMLILFVPGGFEGFFQEMGVPAVEGQGPPPPSQYDKDVEKAGHSFSKYGVELADGVRRSG